MPTIEWNYAAVVQRDEQGLNGSLRAPADLSLAHAVAGYASAAGVSPRAFVVAALRALRANVESQPLARAGALPLRPAIAAQVRGGAGADLESRG